MENSEKQTNMVCDNEAFGDEIGNDGPVYLIACRHDDAHGMNLSAEGAMRAYTTGKYMAVHYDIPAPEHIFFSPISRTRNTAKLHQIALKRNEIAHPSMSYDIRLHEASGQTINAVKDIIKGGAYAHAQCLELVAHQPNVTEIIEYFKASGSVDGLGAFAIIEAPSWKDMYERQNISVRTMESSRAFMFELMGEQQVKILDKMLNPDRDTGLYDDAGMCIDLGTAIALQRQKGVEWVTKALQGEDVPLVSPTEFEESFDAYKFWMNNLAMAIGLPEKPRTTFFEEKISLTDYDSQLKKDLLGETCQTFGEKYLLNQDEYDDAHYDHDRDPGYSYPILNAFLKAKEIKEGIKMSEREAGNQVVADLLSDFPGYRETMQVGELKTEYLDSSGQIRTGGHRYHIADGDDGEGHPLYNKMVWEMLKRKNMSKG